MLHSINKIAESQRELLQAREMIDEAQHSLSSSLEEGNFGDVSSGDIDEDSERLESVKVAAVSSIVGVLASLPISFYAVHDLSQLFFQSSVVFISCALFGVTFRYAVRRDLDNIQLKTGAPAAFAVVRGISDNIVSKILFSHIPKNDFVIYWNETVCRPCFVAIRWNIRAEH
jgi:hypothetical protein